MKRLIIIASMVAIAASYRKGRSSVSSSVENFPPYQRPVWHPPLYDQHRSFRELSPKTQQYPPYRQRSNRQDIPPRPEQSPFRDQPYQDYPPHRYRPYYETDPSFKNVSHGPSSYFADGSSYHQERDQIPYTGKQPSYQDDRQFFRDDYRFPDQYDKPINYYKEQSGQQQVESFGRDPEYLKHGNHGLGYAFVPPISPHENPLPLNEETSTTMAPTTTHQPLHQSTTAAAITQVHTSSTSEPKMAPLKPLYTPTMPPVKAVTDKLAGHTTTIATTRVSTPLISTVTAKLADSTSTENSLPVTEPPIVSFGRQSAAPVEFPAVKFTLPTSYYLPSSSKEKLQQSLLSYLLSQQSKDSVKSAASIVPTSHELSDTLNSNLNNKVQGAVLNYVVPEESKDALKSTLQNSLLNYLLQQQSNHGSTFQQPSLFEATNHAPLTSIVDRPKMTLPSIPIATLSPVSRPFSQPINYIPISMPKVSPFAAQDSSPGLQLDINSFPRIDKLQDTSLPTSLTSSVFNSLPGGINGGISGSISEGVSNGVPTLNLGQNFQYLGQMRPFEPARSQSYSTGLQLQLGGFGGMDYALRSTNPAPRSTNLGITKLGLSLPEFPRFLRPTIPASYVL